VTRGNSNLTLRLGGLGAALKTSILFLISSGSGLNRVGGGGLYRRGEGVTGPALLSWGNFKVGRLSFAEGIARKKKEKAMCPGGTSRKKGKERKEIEERTNHTERKDMRPGQLRTRA